MRGGGTSPHVYDDFSLFLFSVFGEIREDDFVEGLL
jgi:hypothetical protein